MKSYLFSLINERGSTKLIFFQFLFQISTNLSFKPVKTDIKPKAETRKRERSHSILHGVGSDDGGVIASGVGLKAIGKQADVDVPLDEHIAAVRRRPPPHPRNLNLTLPVPLLDPATFRHPYPSLKCFQEKNLRCGPVWPEMVKWTT